MQKLKEGKGTGVCVPPTTQLWCGVLLSNCVHYRNCTEGLLYFPFQVTLYNTDQDGSDSPRSSLNNSLSDQSLASVNLNSVGSVHSYTPVSPHEVHFFVEYSFSIKI